MNEIKNDLPVIQRALEHYIKRLEGLNKTPEIEMSKISEDMTIMINVVNEYINDLQKIKFFDNEDMRKTVCLALECYKDDLENAKVVVKSKINDINLDFKTTDFEIKLASKAKNHHCPSGWDTKT